MPPAGSEHTAFRCAFCYLNLDFMTITQREAHYEHHLTDDPATQHEGSRSAPIDLERLPDSSTFFKALSINQNDTRVPAKKKFRLIKETDAFWYPGLETTPPRSHVPGLIHVLRKGLVKGHNRGNVRRAALCVDNAVLIHREIWDASWGCGYRNFLMACASLMNQQQRPEYFPLLDSPIPPGVRNLQSWIETAWREGFDMEGKKDLQKLIDTRKWIGTADIWVAFVSRRIPAQLVDFDLRDKNKDALINWVVEYFTPKANQEKTTNAFDSLKGSSIISTQKTPLILQHDGHSRTVVGYEVDQKGVTNLLVFDPAFSPNAELRNIALTEYANSNSSPQASTSATHDNKIYDALGLKRKRSMASVSYIQPLNENSKPTSPKSSSRILSPLKNSLHKAGMGHHKTDPDFYGMVKKFRVEPKKLEKKRQYQILYFPMSRPLSDNERNQRKQVTSIKIS